MFDLVSSHRPVKGRDKTGPSIPIPSPLHGLVWTPDAGRAGTLTRAVGLVPTVRSTSVSLKKKEKETLVEVSGSNAPGVRWASVLPWVMGTQTKVSVTLGQRAS